MMDVTIPTTILIISDTHGEGFSRLPDRSVDVAIHCGDLTKESKLDEYRQAIRMLRAIDASLKLVIAGNHDFTLDIPAYKQKLLEANLKPPQEDDLVKKTYGGYGEARALLEAGDAGIILLDEGIHDFKLANGASLKVYASPYTPSRHGGWAFSYHPDDGHVWDMSKEIDIAITHGPPRGIFDYTDSGERAGDPDLFTTIARTRPLLHCFGHIHEGWGTKKVTWRGEQCSEIPSHFTDIDNDKSELIETLAAIRRGKYDSDDDAVMKAEKLERYERQGYCYAAPELKRGMQTLFVNAAIEGARDDKRQLPWLVSLDLQESRREG